MNRRKFLAASGLITLGIGLEHGGGLTPALQPRGTAETMKAADFKLHIAPISLELAPRTVVKAIGYNGTAPGPLLRVPEGAETTVDVYNDLDYPELVHWHGQLIPSDVDGSSEEGTPAVPAHGHRRYSFKASPPGTRWYHTHSRAGSHLDRGLYGGQFGFFYIDPKQEPGKYDKEVFLALREWSPFLTNNEMEDDEEESGGEQKSKSNSSTAEKKEQTKKAGETANGLEVGYRHFSINDRALGHGDPIRVRQAERVMFRVLNASATEHRIVALPGHKFTVVALDGNPVPTQQTVETLALGPAERIDAIVEMNQPGVWIFGTTHNEDRENGMGVVVEYAGHSGKPVWQKPSSTKWDYTVFGKQSSTPANPDGRFELVFQKRPGGKGGFNTWTINGKAYPQHEDMNRPALGPEIQPILVHAGKTYRLVFRNKSDDPHPVHLHRHLFELVNIEGKPTAGVMKDTVMVQRDGQVEVDFVANNPGLTLFHCHQQLHMDFGFMTLLQYV